MTNEKPDWHLRHFDGVEHGPYSFASLVDAAGQGHIAEDTEVLHTVHTKGEWIKATRIKKIADTTVRTNVEPAQPDSANAVTQTTSSDKRNELNWYYSLQNEQTDGPVTSNALMHLIQAGVVKPDSLVFHEDIGSWKRAEEVFPQPSLPQSPPLFNSDRSQGEQSTNHSAPERSFAAELADRINRPNWVRFFPNHPGKWILLLATFLWVVGCPIAFSMGVSKARAGSKYYGASPYGIYDFGAFTVEETLMSARENAFASNSLFWWSVVCGMAGIVGVAMIVCLPNNSGQSP